MVWNKSKSISLYSTPPFVIKANIIVRCEISQFTFLSEPDAYQLSLKVYFEIDVGIAKFRRFGKVSSRKSSRLSLVRRCVQRESGILFEDWYKYKIHQRVSSPDKPLAQLIIVPWDVHTFYRLYIDLSELWKLNSQFVVANFLWKICLYNIAVYVENTSKRQWKKKVHEKLLVTISSKLLEPIRNCRSWKTLKIDTTRMINQTFPQKLATR